VQSVPFGTVHAVAQHAGRRFNGAGRQQDASRHSHPEPAERRHRGRALGYGQHWLRDLHGVLDIATVEQRAHQLNDQPDPDYPTVAARIVELFKEPEPGTRSVGRTHDVGVPTTMRGHPDPKQRPGQQPPVAVEIIVRTTEPVRLGQRPVQFGLAPELRQATDQLAQRGGPGRTGEPFGAQHRAQRGQAGQRDAHTARTDREVST
jgi:hypothetical protein